jgi:DHA2 family multidrug resistance protein-like MFS transporter
MLPVDLFRLPVFALSVATSICSYAAQTIAYLALPFYFQYVGGQSQVRTGLLMTPWPAIVMIVAPIAGRLSDRHSAGLLGGCGLAVLCVGLLLMMGVPADADGVGIALRMLVCGVGFGFFQSPNNRALIAAAPPERSGAGSGMLSTARLIGQTSGGVVVALVFALSGSGVAGISRGVTVAMGVAAGFAAVACVVSFLRLHRSQSG